MMRETRKATFSNRDFGQEEAAEARARRLRMEEAAALERRGWETQRVQEAAPAPRPQTQAASSFEPGSVAVGSDRRNSPAHQPPSPDLAALPDAVLDSLPWPGKPQNRPPAWMLEEDPPQTTEPKQPPAVSAYEQEWNTLRPKAPNPWHTMDEEERKMISHEVKQKEPPTRVVAIQPQEATKGYTLSEMNDDAGILVDGVLDMWKGYGNAAANAVSGLGHLIAHPVDTAVNVGKAVMSPVQTAHALKDQVIEKWESGEEGQGEIIGDVLLGIATGGALKAASGTATVAKLVDKIADVSETAGDIANLGRRIAAGKDAPFNKTDVRSTMKKLDKKGIGASDVQPNIYNESVVEFAERMRKPPGTPEAFDPELSALDPPYVAGNNQVGGHHRRLAAEMTKYPLEMTQIPMRPFKPQRWQDLPFKRGKKQSTE